MYLPQLQFLHLNRNCFLSHTNIGFSFFFVSYFSRRRPQSISSEDGKSRPNGSFRSAGSGCAKLKRHNACRQKSRDVTQLEGRNCIREGETVSEILLSIGAIEFCAQAQGNRFARERELVGRVCTKISKSFTSYWLYVCLFM